MNQKLFAPEEISLSYLIISNGPAVEGQMEEIKCVCN